jgi:Bacteriophage Lambda NinG protein
MKRGTFRKKSYEEVWEAKKQRATSPKVVKKASKLVRSTTPTKNAGKGQNLAKSSKKKTAPSLSKLKKKLDAIFSQYIRLKHPAKCYTCGLRKNRKHLQCGHFISRSYLVTRFDENNCRPQCVGCNMFGNGKPLDFEENLKKELGDEFVEEMKASRHKIVKLDRLWYGTMIAEYSEKVKSLV